GEDDPEAEQEGHESEHEEEEGPREHGRLLENGVGPARSVPRRPPLRCRGDGARSGDARGCRRHPTTGRSSATFVSAPEDEWTRSGERRSVAPDCGWPL